ncbi:DUF4232 domain-containing protein [Corynebacterium crudilactis]|uniref:DUF4232 domain-containing protein n=1 Tax=Corynebacterium crudilactis TaxID=1652495 RepID=UPI001FDF2ACB|nr:DUF4232 domain-containing protein [Corynebacterium crudilactis]
METSVSGSVSTAVETPIETSTISETVTTTVSSDQPPTESTRCATADLEISLSGQQGAAGSTLVDVNFSNLGATDCTLQGFPGVSLVGLGNGTQIGAPASREQTDSPTITLQPGESTIAALRISRAENYDPALCAPKPADGLRVYPPGDTASAFLHMDGLQGCSNEEVELLSVKAVGA